MLAPDTPYDEAHRLSLLRNLALLDSEPEEAFDRITRLAQAALAAPAVFISLLNADRQWFKSKVGLDICELPLEVSFCKYTVLTDQMLIVPDTRQDARFADNPMVVGAPFIRFYAGYPLHSDRGIRLGTLCAIDYLPRQPDAPWLQLLGDLGHMTEREIQQREASLVALDAHTKGLDALLESKLDLDVTFEQAAVGIAFVDLDGSWLRVNRKLCELLGYAEERLLGLTFQEITYPDDLETDLAQLQRLLNGQLSHYTTEKRYFRGNGEIIWINLTVSLRRQANGNPLHFISVIEDIHNRKLSEAALRELRENLEQRVVLRTEELHAANASLMAALNQQQQTEAVLRRNEANVRSILETAYDAFVSIDETGAIIEWNRQAELLFGWRRDEVLKQPLENTIIPPAWREQHNRGLNHFLRTGEGPVLNKLLHLQARCRDGRDIPVELTITSANTTPLRFNAFLRDISERLAVENALRESRLQLKTITDQLPALVCYLDREGRYQFANATFRTWYGVDPDAMLGKTVGEALGAQHARDVQPYWERALAGEALTYERQETRAGQHRYASCTYLPHLQDDQVIGCYVMVQDITDSKQLELSLKQQATEDMLTGLANRRGFTEQWEQAAARSKRLDKECAILYMDLDGFKGINDRYGHDSGDAVLVAFGERIKSCIRRTDSLARLGGDEFVVILEGLAGGLGDAAHVAAKIIEATRAPLELDDLTFTLSTSIGIAGLQQAGGDAAACIKLADDALYLAKRGGKCRFVIAQS
ncbi:PAS domain S-box protein [Chitiniphilus purpureus]|uniref:PAS domain S-box protein n=1 Tax=Chitiniphilus purpureus TaxID=2981137 RepID=A0ABY6DL82_9NEIS|nr:PAS domain S-box protein [Chitiniphilus sp. CD1]UXY14231.1 PAS domain S-box protein [Chitiniphilus sp. CD1]